jgi:hypothetical protein
MEALTALIRMATKVWILLSIKTEKLSLLRNPRSKNVFDIALSKQRCQLETLLNNLLRSICLTVPPELFNHLLTLIFSISSF